MISVSLFLTVSLFFQLFPHDKLQYVIRTGIPDAVQNIDTLNLDVKMPNPKESMFTKWEAENAMVMASSFYAAKYFKILIIVAYNQGNL